MILHAIRVIVLTITWFTICCQSAPAQVSTTTYAQFPPPGPVFYGRRPPPPCIPLPPPPPFHPAVWLLKGLYLPSTQQQQPQTQPQSGKKKKKKIKHAELEMNIFVLVTTRPKPKKIPVKSRAPPHPSPKLGQHATTPAKGPTYGTKPVSRYSDFYRYKQRSYG